MPPHNFSHKLQGFIGSHTTTNIIFVSIIITTCYKVVYLDSSLLICKNRAVNVYGEIGLFKSFICRFGAPWSKVNLLWDIQTSKTLLALEDQHPLKFNNQKTSGGLVRFFRIVFLGFLNRVGILRERERERESCQLSTEGEEKKKFKAKRLICFIWYVDKINYYVVYRE